jgi:NodT family efflux transporter outer membrane factor (OMF) lipoprotein
MIKFEPFMMNRKSAAVGLSFLGFAMLSGCAVGPDYVAPVLPQTTQYTRADTIAESAAMKTIEVSDQWWNAYESPRINQLIHLALIHNPNIEGGMANLKQAQEYVTAQRGLYFPQIQGGFSLNKQNSGKVIASPLVSGDSLFNLRTAQLNVSFTPDIFGANQRQVESLQAYADSQKYQLEALKITIASNVATAVIQEQLLLEQMMIMQEALDSAKEQLAHTQRLLANGYASGVDLAQQEATYAQMAAMLPPLHKQLELTRDVLAVLCGQYPQSELIKGQPQSIATPKTLPFTVPSQLVASRPDVKAAEELLHSTHALIGVAVANMLPQINLSAGVSYSGPSASNLFGSDNKSWSVLGGLTAPLFTAGTLSARKRAAEQAASAAQSQYKSVVLNAFQNVADTLYSLDADQRSLDVAYKGEKANQDIYILTQKQFKNGYVSAIQLLGTKQNWLTAKANSLNARMNYLMDTVALFQAMGGGWRASSLNGQD